MSHTAASWIGIFVQDKCKIFTFYCFNRHGWKFHTEFASSREFCVSEKTIDGYYLGNTSFWVQSAVFNCLTMIIFFNLHTLQWELDELDTNVVNVSETGCIYNFMLYWKIQVWQWRYAMLRLESSVWARKVVRDSVFKNLDMFPFSLDK